MFSKINLRFILFIASIGGIFYFFPDFIFPNNKKAEDIPKVIDNQEDIKDKNKKNTSNQRFFVKITEDYLPKSTGEIVIHSYYALAFNRQYKQAEWVAYELTPANLEVNAHRANDFRPDPALSESPKPSDYVGSGYAKGHLAPANDFTFDADAMSETFFMSNMTPQSKDCNIGIWKILEDDTRNWARKYGRLFVCTGPVLQGGVKKYIGKNKVGVPRTLYKILLRVSEKGEAQAIGFLIPNQMCTELLRQYAVTIDEIERQTGVNFFPDLFKNKADETRIEGEMDFEAW